MRVVSLVPSATETLVAWGVDVVACTRFCEQPTIVHVGGTKDPDIAAIVALAPDLVVVDREENRREDAEALERAGIALHVTHVVALGDVAPMMAALATAVGASPEPMRLDAERPTWASAAVMIWRRPWMTLSGDTYAASVLEHLGIVNVFAEADSRYPTVELSDVVGREPGLILLPTEPYPFGERHVAELAATLGTGVDIRIVDGQDLFWWGARTASAVERLRASLRPPAPPPG